MKTKSEELKEKEKAERIKNLRRDIQEKMEEQLPPEMLNDRIRVEVSKIDESELTDPIRAKQVVEALLFASSKPLTVQEIKKVLKPLSPRHIQSLIEELRNDYQQGARSFEICEIAGGYEISTRKEFAPWICKIELQKKTRQATQSALETLAILAYKQPLTRAEIEDLRGVDSSGVLAGLMERGFLRIVGKKEVPGRPFLYSTTEKFLEHFGLKGLEDLPSLEEIKSVVEQSVKRDELIGTQKIVDVAATGLDEKASVPVGEPDGALPPEDSRGLKEEAEETVF